MGCGLCTLEKCRTTDRPPSKLRRLLKLVERRETPPTTQRLEIGLRSVVLIQRWYRRYLARMELRRRYTWTIFQSIEYAGELDQIKLYNFFNALLEHFEDMQDCKRVLTEVQTDLRNRMYGWHVNLKRLTDPSSTRVDSAYRGPRLSFPLTQTGLTCLIEGFKNDKLLHAHYVCGLLHEAIRVLRTMPTLNRASAAVAGHITVCGDLHGKLDDLLVIFHKNGIPSSDNPYVFNGDFVDRGKHSVEVILVLLACVVVNPHEVYLNRGNHEDPMMNLRYGFTREVISKYKSHSAALLTLFEEVFAWLPVGTIIDRRVLVVHGGVAADTDISWLETLQRNEYSSLLRMPERLQGSTDSMELMRRKIGWRQIRDVLWSDPHNESGCEPNEFRGGGCYFGPDITQKILRINQLELLIRSHECKSDGYEYTHDGKCLTIFSASNYYGPGSNRGAYVVLQGAELRPHFVQFTAQTKPKYISMWQRVGALEATALDELRKKILASKPALTNEFHRRDPKETGLISANDWAAVMEDHCCSSIPWRVLRQKIVPLDSHSSMIAYQDTFSGTVVATNNEDSPSVVESLYRNRERLETIFRILDKDHSGYLSLDEFADACSLLKKYLHEPITYDEMVNMARSIDINKDGFIDFNEFLETFRLVDMGSTLPRDVR